MADQSKCDKLQELIGFDPVKKNTITSELFTEVVKEIQEERQKEAKAKAKEHLVKAIDLRSQMEKARKDFENQYKKFEKDLGKLLNQIQCMLSGKSPEESEESGEKSCEAKNES